MRWPADRGGPVSPGPAGASLPVSQAGSGSILALLLVAVVAVFCLVLTVASGLALQVRRAGAAADAAALAAADVASGLLAGLPCPAAERVAAADGALVRECRVDGQIAQVTVEVHGRWPVRATARAGPPGSA